MPKVENGHSSNSFPPRVPRTTEKIRAPTPWRDHRFDAGKRCTEGPRLIARGCVESIARRRQVTKSGSIETYRRDQKMRRRGKHSHSNLKLCARNSRELVRY